jgi:hypothetical protein
MAELTPCRLSRPHRPRSLVETRHRKTENALSRPGMAAFSLHLQSHHRSARSFHVQTVFRQVLPLGVGHQAYPGGPCQAIRVGVERRWTF